MGVYIKNMDMPEECYCCPCSQPTMSGRQGRCNLLWRDFSGNPHMKYQDCPLVEVAEPHGRLIDADALMVYCRNQKSRTIDCNDIARFPTTVPRVIVESEE